MYYDYSPIYNRTLDKCSDINVFKDSGFYGFFRFRTVNKMFGEYYQLAVETAKDVSWDYVVMYAVFEYEKHRQKIISVNFMTLAVPYGMYIKAVRKLCSENCRLFFIRGRKECYCE